LGIECLENGENQLEELCVVGEEGKKKKKKVNIRATKQLQKLNGVGKFVKTNSCITKKKCQFKCYEKFTENDRQIIFDNFWKLGNKSRQRDFLIQCVIKGSVKRIRTKIISRLSNTYSYFLSYMGNKYQVCQQYLLTTLDIKQNFLLYTINNSLPVATALSDGRGKVIPKNKTNKTTVSKLREFIKKLPAVPSHYCRASTTKKYLPADLMNILRLYAIYKDYCKTNNDTPVSKFFFRKVFTEEYNIGFYLPKKDKCRTCSKFDNIINLNGDSSQDESIINHQKHINDKEDCKAMFLKYQNPLDNTMSLCVSFDLQKVLNTPKSDNMNLYYSRKFSTYNLTIYESRNQNAFCYLWSETIGNRRCNEIVSCVYNYLISVDQRQSITSIALFCDSCAGQNKNKAMFAMIKYVLKYELKCITEIKLTFLLPGHTYMPVDSIHGTIERFIKKTTVWPPIIIRNARTNPRPLEVIELKSTDFLDWKQFSTTFFPKILKTETGDRVMNSELRSLLFIKKDEDVDF